MTIKRLVLICAFAVLPCCVARAANKPKLTLDEFFNWVEVESIKVSPDGHSFVIATDRADWNQAIFRDDLWLYREDGHGGGALLQLTQSGHDRHPQWSPDGRWIAFLSDRKLPAGKGNDSDDDPKEAEVTQLYLIAAAGGEAFPVTKGQEEVHAFAWSPDSRTLYFSTRIPWTKTQRAAYKQEWKDVERYRGSERGDMIFSIDVADAMARHAAEGGKPDDDSDAASDAAPGSHALARTPWRASELVASPDGHRLAFATTSVSQREEKVGEFEIYSIELAGASPERPPHQVTHNEAVELNLHWAQDSRHIFFQVQNGSAEGRYRDTQYRLYWVDADTGEVQRWASDFAGAILHYSVMPDGGVVAMGRLGTEVQAYSQAKVAAPFTAQAGWKGTYELIATSEHSSRIAFVNSSLEKPT